LPSSPLSLSHDRFSITDADTDDPIPFWLILRAILYPVAQSVSQLIETLDTIAITLRGSSNPDSHSLRHFLLAEWDSESFFERAWPQCVQIALEMPILFPTDYLVPLSVEKPAQMFTKRQIACLVIHQFLCTLPRLPWMPPDDQDTSQDLHIWYSGDQPHPKAISAYLAALCTFFERVASDAQPNPSNSMSLTLYSSPGIPHCNATTLFQPICINDIATPTINATLLGLPSGACVISSNSHIGFGRTASQEEMHVGCTPESLPAKLLVPPLKDNEVVVLRGCEALIEMTGYGRRAELSAIPPAGTYNWSGRTMLFMDALELDSFDTSASTPDLLPGNVDRELTKAYTAFSSYEGAAYETVVTGHWGCGAFGGNREIKSIIQWCAASMAGVKLNFV
ncbi:hypothetical protein B0H10DRAFT_1708908, partial [Mycena sp. CBHHK59/15]